MDAICHGGDLRKGRVSIPGQAYLITTVVRDRYPVFRNLMAGRVLVQALRRHQIEGFAETLAFVVMPDHLHWLMVLGERGNLSSVVQALKSGSSRRIRGLESQYRKFAWQRGFHDRALRRDENLRVVARYVVANPLRAGLVTEIAQYTLWDAVWL